MTISAEQMQVRKPRLCAGQEHVQRDGMMGLNKAVATIPVSFLEVEPARFAGQMPVGLNRLSLFRFDNLAIAFSDLVRSCQHTAFLGFVNFDGVRNWAGRC